jgi:hypothetical protein
VFKNRNIKINILMEISLCIIIKQMDLMSANKPAEDAAYDWTVPSATQNG